MNTTATITIELNRKLQESGAWDGRRQNVIDRGFDGDPWPVAEFVPAFSDLTYELRRRGWDYQLCFETGEYFCTVEAGENMSTEILDALWTRLGVQVIDACGDSDEDAVGKCLLEVLRLETEVSKE